MKAVIHHAYGPVDKVLSVEDIEPPTPKDNEVLVRVHAASMHPDVWHVIEGVPLAMRLFGNGLRKPKRRVPGTDFSGRVEAVGKNVSKFTTGDEVFGETVPLGWWNGGAYAEYAAVSQDLIAPKPPNITFEQAAVVPTSGFIALSNLGIDRSFQATHVLINGAGGCVGMLAIQIVKASGGRVTAVDRTEKLGLLQSLGADTVIDYTTNDVVARNEQYDFVLDVASTLSAGARYSRLLAPGGVYVPIGHAHFGRARGRMGGRIVGSLPYFIGRLLVTLLVPSKRKGFRFPTRPEALTRFTQLIESGQLTPVIARTFPLSGVAQAMSCMQDPTVVGRVVIVP